MAYQGLNKTLRYELKFRRVIHGGQNIPTDAGELTLRRKDLGLTQKELGEKLGVDRNTIARWENKKIGFPRVLVDLALESLENKHKKEVKKLNQLARANGTGGETGEPEYDTSGFRSWIESPVKSDTNESDESTASDNQ